MVSENFGTRFTHPAFRTAKLHRSQAGSTVKRVRQSSRCLNEFCGTAGNVERDARQLRSASGGVNHRTPSAQHGFARTAPWRLDSVETAGRESLTLTLALGDGDVGSPFWPEPLRARLHIEALNHALAGIPPERMRMHMCRGNYEGPHHHDVPLAEIINVVFTARPATISFEAANPRHAHEWTLFERVKLPDGKIIIPGVIESKSNFIEHPELIAQRITRYANLVGLTTSSPAAIEVSAPGSAGPWSIPTWCGRNWRRWPKALGWPRDNSGAVEAAQCSAGRPKAQVRMRLSAGGESAANSSLKCQIPC
jgi:hypothetical protein